MPTLESLVAAERAFAAAAKANGTRAGFVEFLAADSIIFRPGPINGKHFWEAAPSRPGQLAWYPAYAGIAASGELGFTTGPWEFWPAESTAPVGFGHYISVWQVQPDGTWRVKLDTGIQVGEGASPKDGIYAHWSEAALEPHSRGHQSAVPTNAADLLAHDRRFSQAASHDALAAYAHYTAPEARLYRDEHHPFVGQGAHADGLALWQGGKITWQPQAGGVSESGDFGYTYGLGTLTATDGQTTQRAYLHLWRRDVSGAWKLWIDVDNPFPPTA